MNYRKKFKKCKSIEERAKIVAEWTHTTLQDFGNRSSSMTPLECRNSLEKLENESVRFCGRSISEEGWNLHQHFFRMILAQASTNPGTESLFDHFGWDYEKSLNPLFNDETSLISVVLHEKSGDIKVDLLIQSSGHVPLGSIWSNKRSGKLWKINFIEENGIFEMEPFQGNHFRECIFRKQKDIQKTFERV